MQLQFRMLTCSHADPFSMSWDFGHLFPVFAKEIHRLAILNVALCNRVYRQPPLRMGHMRLGLTLATGRAFQQGIEPHDLEFALGAIVAAVEDWRTV